MPNVVVCFSWFLILSQNPRTPCRCLMSKPCCLSLTLSILPDPLWLLNEFCLCLDELIGKGCATAPHRLSSPHQGRVLDSTPRWMYVHAAEFQRSLWGFVLNEEKAGHTAWCKLAKEKESAIQLQLLQHHAGSWSPWCWRLSSSSYCPPDSVHN